MSSLTKYAGTISQTTGGNYRSFSDLNNLKTNEDYAWANSNGNIKGKGSSPSRPSTLTFKNFNFNLPTGAEVSKVIVTYRHKKTGSLNIPAPTLTLLGTGSNTFSVKGSAPTTSMVTHQYNCTTSKITRSQVNSSDFGVKLDYPSNTSTSEGTMSISYVRVTVEYKVPSYALTLKKVSGGYNEESYTVEASISNTNLTSYNPTLTLTAPTGFSFDSMGGTGSYTQVSPTTISWNPKLTNKTASSTALFKFDVDVTYPSGQSSYTGTFTLSESLYSSSKSLSATITERPPEEQEETAPDSTNINTDTADQFQIYQCTVGEEFEYTFTLSDEEYNLIFEDVGQSVRMAGSNFQIYFENMGGWKELNEAGFTSSAFDSNHSVTRPIKKKNVGYSEIEFYYLTYDSTLQDFVHHTIATFKFDVMPGEEDLSIPDFALLSLSEEECDRLGDGYTYIAESMIKHTTTDTFTRDWYKNNRVGVFNNTIENVSDYTNLTDSQIFENALYWSSETAGLNEYNSVECEFTYDEDYPLYVIITGDYPEATTYGYDVGTIKYTEPCIIEKAVYQSAEPNGTYPIPITALLDGEDIATLELVPNQTSQSVILYDFPVDESVSTNDHLAIRGLQVRANIEATDNLVVQAKLHSPTGEVGNRSVLIDSEDEEIVIGGLGDLWGFTTLQMQHLELWQLELAIANILGNTNGTILFNNVEIIFYLETVEKQQITIRVEDEDIAYYGAFIETVTIPEGLNTDTSFLTIDGTDTNDAYRQNIREKTITIEFNLSQCDIQTSTDMLRQLTKLFVNEKDKYNRPIPKRIQFSHYPNDYFEYIMEEPFDIDTEITDYNIKAKLTIPSGTSYSLYDTVTNTTGNVSGLAAVNPIITIRPSDVNVQVTESNTGQSFNIAYTGNWNDHTVEIDCEDRKVYIVKDDDTRIDISKYADYNSDWFRLDGEYDFSSVNCTILSVLFNERW